MSDLTGERAREMVDAVYRADSRRVLATLIRLLGDFDRAEEAMHDAFTAAIEQWPQEGVPANPRAWLVSAGRFKAIDAMRRRARLDASLAELAERIAAGAARCPTNRRRHVEDDRLRLIFTCCHPALTLERRSRSRCAKCAGLTTEEIGRAFLTNPPPSRSASSGRRRRSATPASRIRCRRATTCPSGSTPSCTSSIWCSTKGMRRRPGSSLTRCDVSAEAIRLGRLLVELLPEPEAMGLLALMLLHESRRAARSTSDGELVLLADQDRSLWDREQIAEGISLVERAISSRRFGPYTLQAAIAAVHADAPPRTRPTGRRSSACTTCCARSPSPVIELNRAAAIAMRDGPAAGLAIVDAILARGDLDGYHLAHSARADLCRRLGRVDDARAAYQRALELVRQEPARRFWRRGYAGCTTHDVSTLTPRQS